MVSRKIKVDSFISEEETVIMCCEGVGNGTVKEECYQELPFVVSTIISKNKINVPLSITPTECVMGVEF